MTNRENPFSSKIYNDDENNSTSNGKLKKYNFDDTMAQDHLNNAPDQYYEVINNSALEELIDYENKIRPLKKHLPDAARVLSVGVGGGVELRALKNLYPDNTEILGIDLSKRAVESSRKSLDLLGIDATVMQGSVVDMPFKDEENKIDGIVLSAILHEVYSYIPDGSEAWKKAIKETAESLSKNGVFLLRDFAAPPLDKKVSLSFKDEQTKKFYKYFRSTYRTFGSWKEESSSQMAEKGKCEKYYPEVNENDNSIEILLSYAAEMMLHYKIYLKSRKKGIIDEHDPNWKEIDETYLVPDPYDNERTIMTPKKYKERVIEAANEALVDSGYEVVCIEDKLAGRPDVSKLFKKKFEIKSDSNDEDSADLFDLIPKKMEYVFKKIKVDK